MKEVIEHVNRLKSFPPLQAAGTAEKHMTINQLLSTIAVERQRHTDVICSARIEEIHEHRTWYYARCSKCRNTLFLQDDQPYNFVCKDHDDIIPNFMYCVNATITDDTGSTAVIFFNEGMTSLLNVTCEHLVVQRGYTDQKKIPPEIATKIGTHLSLHLAFRRDDTIVVTSAVEPHPLQTDRGKLIQSGEHYFGPTTPSKRTFDDPSDARRRQKKID